MKRSIKEPLKANEAGSSFQPSRHSLKILVLDADCNAATCVVQSLGRAGHRIHLGGSSENACSFRSRYVRQKLKYPSPLESRKFFLEWFKNLIGVESFDYILPLSDLTIYPLRSLSPIVPGIILPPDGSFEWFFDKAKTLELADRCHVPFPRTILLNSVDEIDSSDLGSFPYFIKLTRSKIWIGDRGMDLEAKLARTPLDLTETVASLTHYGPVLVQEYEPGVGVGIEMLCSRGRVLIAFAHQRIHEYPLTGGGSTYRVSIPLPPSLLEASERLVKEADWTGVAMVEFKKDGDRYSLMEVNGRFWGSLPLSYRCGIDFPKALIDLFEGRPVRERPGYRTGIYSRRFSTDFSWFKRNLVADKNDPYTKTRPLGRTFLEYSRFLTGRDHWDHAFFWDPFPVLVEIGRTLKKNVQDFTFKGYGLLVTRIGTLRSRVRLKRMMKEIGPQMTPTRILVVCYGNICRSPFVENFLRMRLDQEVFEIRSCGFVKQVGRPSPENYVFLSREAGIDLSSHQSTVISKDLVAWADFILLMDFRNWKEMRSFSGEALGKVLWLGGWSEKNRQEIPDPYGKGQEEIRRIISEMKIATNRLSKDFSCFRSGKY